MPNWTNEQKQAIYKKGTNILVAAAAGSGKTAVLVERIINKVINEKIDIDKLLVVTFTNAAAAEMKERVLDALYKKIEEDPENKDLQRQITLINMAQICTIDSFCLDIVKNYFYELENISPNFRIAETTEIELLKQETLDEIFEEKYINEDENFTDLIKTYTNYRDDTPLKDLILKIYNFISSNPSPLEWLEEKVEMFNLKNKLDEDFSQTIWGQVLLNDVSEEIQDDMAMLKDVASSLSYDTELENFKNTILSDIEQLKNLQNNLNNWDNTYKIAQNFKFIDWPRKKVTSEIKDEAKAIRDQVRKKLYDKLDDIFVSDSRQSNQDIFDMYKTLIKLRDLIIEFDKQFSKKKREKNILDFSDIEHFALSILVKKDDQGNLVKTEVAEKYTQKFEEIAIDEYQDSNLVQETILTSVSRGNNLFMVGDVKQSIYKFRQAMPKLFLSKYNEYEIVEDEAEKLETIQDMKKGKKIQLFKNFRSRENILDFTNLVFQNIMSEKIGEIEYNKNEYLNLGATDYKETNQELKTEIEIIETNYNKEEFDNKENEIEINSDDDEVQDLEKIEDIEVEAKYIAKKIKELVQNKYQIYDRKNESFRDIKYKDIVILLRSTKEKANIYEQEMINLGLPVFSDSSEQYLETIEIQTILNLLKIIDNPIQDIPLVSVLRSNIGKFNDNELVEIRLSDKYDNFYNCMQKAVLNVDTKLKEKINNFLENLQKWRKEKEYLALDELIWKIYIETGFYNYVGLMPNGELRQANLKMLFEKARQYESASFKGLYNFIQFMEKLQLSSGDMGTAKIIGENDDVVRIMSIHKSKGLEFPVVFLANTNKQFNMQDIRKDQVLLHQDFGIGVKYINYDEQIQYDTLSREAVKKQVENENISEEMRILYVALTRAKEKLYITGIGKDIQEKIEKWENLNKIYPKEDGKINHLLIKKAKSYLDWIILVYINEKDSHSLKLEIKDKKEEMNKWNKLLNNMPENIQEETEFEHKENLYKTIQKKLEYKYAFLASTVIPTKISVTKIKELEQEKIKSLDEITSQQQGHTKNIEKLKETENIKTSSKEEKSEFRKPEFLKENKDEKLTSAQKGTITHLCLQKLDAKKEYNLEEIQNFIIELQNTNILTEKEAKSVNPYKILEFTKSQIGQDLKEAKEIYKEKPFYLNIPAKEIYEDENIDENILVQGIIDLYYIDKNDKLVLVDYKTDYVPEGKENELISKYNSQLSLYKTALEEALSRKVDKKYIYSIYLGKALEI